MKFALLTLEYPPTRGGVATYYSGMVSELRAQGHEVEVIEKGLVSRFVNPHWFAGIFTVWNLLQKSKPDFLIVGHVLPLGTIAYLFRKRTPYIVCTHGMDVALAANSFRKKMLATKILQNAHRVISNSEFTANLVSGFGVAVDRITMLPPCPQALTIVSDLEVHATRELFGLVGKKVILSVGRLVLRKGFDTLVEALPEILKTTPSAILVIAGEGGMSGKLVREAKKLGVEGSVRFVGGVDKKTLAALYQSAHVFAMPCRAIGPDVEGFGTVYLEAGQFGVPSVAGQSGGASEAVLDRKTGLVVEPIKEAVAAAITQLLHHEDQRKEFGEAAKEFSATFSWKNNIRKLLNSI